MTAAQQLDAMLNLAEAAIRDAQEHEHAHHLTTRHTRQLPRGILRQLHHWQKQVTTEHAANLCESQPIAPATGSEADKQDSPSVREEPAVESPIVGVRLEPETFEELDIKARRTGHTRASLARYFIRRGLHLANNGHEHAEGDTPSRNGATASESSR